MRRAGTRTGSPRQVSAPRSPTPSPRRRRGSGSLLGSRHVVTARRDGALIGLARVVGDGAVLAYLQDVLVCPEAQGQGIGRRLVEEVLAPFDAVRQQVLLTDAEPGQRAFYEALGFVEAHDHDPGLRSFVRLR